MATQRAKRLERFFNNELRVQIGSKTWSCPHCHFMSFDKVKFCSDCGRPMNRHPDKSNVLDNIEMAIAYALGERE